ncbi:hypothetical protein SAMN04488504_12760 [Myxococcus virescens]|uniref:Uncharacterized protein n=1 Tax=Myxococcus virescens TaxID=83456 RepID=A0ABY0NCR5_9BACT|nr:hypothetical protein SAMN04488504_12760 [Myxococcus virescens]
MEARHATCFPPSAMSMKKRRALAERLGRAEVDLQRAHARLDGSPEARTRLAEAKAEYRLAEAAALQMLGAREALVPVEACGAGEVRATVGLLAEGHVAAHGGQVAEKWRGTRRKRRARPVAAERFLRSGAATARG